MIYNFDHIGITVPNLAEACARLEGSYSGFHTQHRISVRDALRQVSKHRPKRMSIALHRKGKGPIIELIEYPRVARGGSTLLPWSFQPGDSLAQHQELIAAHRSPASRVSPATESLSLLIAQQDFNAVVVPTANLVAETQFWAALRWTELATDTGIAVLGLKPLLPQAETCYLVLYEVDRTSPGYTDLEGLNEIALLCSSCSKELENFPGEAFRSSVDHLEIGDRNIEMGYLRAPSGVLVELLSVKLVGKN